MQQKTRVVAAGLAAALVLSVWASGGSSGPTTAPAGAVTITAIKGSATVTRPDKSTAPATVGTALKVGEVIAVTAGGLVELKMGDGNVLKLTGGAKFRVGDAKPMAPQFDLLQGEMFASLGALPKGGKASVKTPTGVAGVEGTQFRVRADEKLGTEVTVAAGLVNLQSNDAGDKHVPLRDRQTARLVTWENAIMRETGSGVPPDLPPADDGAGARTVIVAAAASVIPSDAPDPQAAEAAAEQNARTAALADLSNRLGRFPVSRTQTLGQLLLAKGDVLAKVAAYAAKAQETKREKLEDSRVLVELTLDLKDLGDLIGGGVTFSRTIRELSLAEYGKAFGGQRRLMAYGAAREDAKRKLTERIYGVVVDSKTTVRDFAAADDTVVTRTQGLLKGAKEMATRYFADGTVEVDMQVTGPDCVAAIDPDHKGRLGQNYLSAPSPADLSLIVRFQQVGL